MPSPRYTSPDDFIMLTGHQRDDLCAWKYRLNAECYEDLVEFAVKNTFRATKPGQEHRVPRGCALQEFVINWRPRRERTEGGGV